MMYRWDFEVPGYAKGVLVQKEPDEAEAITTLRAIYGSDAELLVEARSVEQLSKRKSVTRSRNSTGRREDTVRGVDSRHGVSPSNF